MNDYKIVGELIMKYLRVLWLVIVHRYRCKEVEVLFSMLHLLHQSLLSSNSSQNGGIELLFDVGV